MNHVFALVWNAAQGCWTVTHEHTKRCRKGAGRVAKVALPALMLSLFVDSAQAACSPLTPLECSYNGGTYLSGGTLTLTSSTSLGPGPLTIGGPVTLYSSGYPVVGNDIDIDSSLTLEGWGTLGLTGALSGNGILTKQGSGTLSLAGRSAFSGTYNILEGWLHASSNEALGIGSHLNLGKSTNLELDGDVSIASLSGSGSVITYAHTLTVGTDGSDSTFDGGLYDFYRDGTLVKVGKGTLTLTKVNPLNGAVLVSEGTLRNDNIMGSARVTVSSGAALTGSGSFLGPVTIQDGGHLSLRSGNTLSVGSLTMSPTSNLDVALGVPSFSPLLQVYGQNGLGLVLDGQLNVTDASGFGAGVYRLISYSGGLTDNGMSITPIPGYGIDDLMLQTTAWGQLNLVVTTPNAGLRFWDGSQSLSNKSVDGGTGVWSSADTNWTTSRGSLNQTWNDQFAVFQGNAGTVSVEGTQAFTGMQFATNGYRLVEGTEGALVAVDGGNGFSVVRVDGWNTASIDVDIGGSAGLAKRDMGTLVLSGNNTYAGGTSLEGGTLVLGSDSAIGTGLLRASAGTQLDTTQEVTLDNNVELNGHVSMVGSHDLTLAGALSGTGTLVKNGYGSLTLGGGNTFHGAVMLNSGSLVLASEEVLRNSSLTTGYYASLSATTDVILDGAVNLGYGNLGYGNLTIEGSHDITLNGPVNGYGGLNKIGSSNLTLAGDNHYQGYTSLGGGTLTLASESALGTGELTVNGPSTLRFAASELQNNIRLYSDLTLDQPNNKLGGVISGWGNLKLSGGGETQLLNHNTYYRGTQLDSGRLYLGYRDSMGYGPLTVTGRGMLETAGAMTLTNSINVQDSLTLNTREDLTLGGQIYGDGTLYKLSASDLILSSYNYFNGTLDILEGDVYVQRSGSLSGGTKVSVGEGTSLNLAGSAWLSSLDGPGITRIESGSSLSIGAGDANSTYLGSLQGTGNLIKTGNGSLKLALDDRFTGDTYVYGGVLDVTGTLASSQVNVSYGGTLQGSADLTGDLYVSYGGTLNAAQGSTLKVGSLHMGWGSTLMASLGAPVLGGGSALIDVQGDLTLGGTIGVRDLGGFGSGVYRLIDYTGSLTPYYWTGIGTLPEGLTASDVQVQTSMANRVNLLVQAPSTTVQFWDSTQVMGNGAVDSGSGTWSRNGTNWTDVSGTFNREWANSFAVFQGKPGTVTVDGPQWITGMQFVDDGFVLEGDSLNLSYGGSGMPTVRVDSGATATLNVDIGGYGNLAKLDGGTLVLNGAMTSYGGTSLKGGTLVLGSAQALGWGSLNADGGTTLDNSVAMTLSNGLWLNGGLTIGGSNDLELAGYIGGDGSLIKRGSSGLTLSGYNYYTGGTMLDSGTLVLGNASALGTGTLTASNDTTLDTSIDMTLANNIRLDGGLTLAGSNSLELTGNISGSGSLVKEGSSGLTLSGNNTFSGLLDIRSGNLALTGANSLGNATLSIAEAASVSLGGSTVLDVLSGSGDLALDTGSRLEVGGSNTGSVYDGSLNGSGSLSKVGTGKLVLNGQSVVDGGTQVSDGILVVGQAAGSDATLDSDVQVNSGAMLGGHGTIDGDIDVFDGAKLNPGNSIGTLRVVGDVDLVAGSTLEIEAQPDSASDKLQATGTVSIDGANLSVLGRAGTWSPVTRYTIIEAGALTGTFTNVVSDLSFLTPSVTYSGTDVGLTLTRNDVSFAEVGVTSNQRAIAAAIDSQGVGELYDAVVGLNNAQAQASFDSLSGEIHASTQGALFDDSRYIRDGISQRLREAQGRAPADGVLHSDADTGLTFWMQAYGGWGDTAATRNTAKLEHETQGTLFGIDMPVNDTWRLGAAVGHGTSKLDAKTRDSSSEIDSTSLTLYAAAQWDALNLRMGATRAWGDIDTSRYVNAGGLGEHDKAGYDAKTTQVFGELGYAVKAGEFTVEPFVGVARVKVDSDGVKEKGGATALRGESQKDSVNYSNLGVHASTPLANIAGVPVSVQGTLSWQHAFDGLDTRRELALAGGSRFTVQGAPMARDTAVAQFGVKAQVAQDATVDVGYAGQFGDGYRDNGVRVGLRVSF